MYHILQCEKTPTIHQYIIKGVLIISFIWKTLQIISECWCPKLDELTFTFVIRNSFILHCTSICILSTGTVDILTSLYQCLQTHLRGWMRWILDFHRISDINILRWPLMCLTFIKTTHPHQYKVWHLRVLYTKQLLLSICINCFTHQVESLKQFIFRRQANSCHV